MDLNPCPEPDSVYPEKLFEMALRNLIQFSVQAPYLIWTTPRIGLDIAFEVQSSTNLSRECFEIEAKSYGGQRNGGVGFGAKRGGTQVDLLLSSRNAADLLETNVRWAFVNATLPSGYARYALLTTSEACNAAMGEVAHGKQNNFSIAKLRAHWTVWPVFCEKLYTILGHV
jgi:hypothetical protein